MVGVEQGAEIRRLYFVKRLSIKEIVRRTGHGRNTVRRALRSSIGCARRSVSAGHMPGRCPLEPEPSARIGLEPQSVGRRLVGRLEGLWSARVGNYRVLYTIEQSRIIIRAIRHRAVAYRRRRR